MPDDPNRPASRAPALRGALRLGFDAVGGVTDVVEQLHRTIADVAGPLDTARPPRTRGLTGLVYGAVRGGTRGVARALDLALQHFGPRVAHGPLSPRREAALAALNGIWGDHLAATGNPLAIEMRLRVGGRALTLTPQALRQQFPAAGPRVLVLLHGLCMNDLQWARNGHEHGRALAAATGRTPIWLHYNSGLHISDNGCALADLLQRLHSAWPVPLTELALVGHSMGGLVARSAIHQAEQRGLAWRGALTHLLCLGTPHHGALLERGGHRVDKMLQLSPYVAPFARLGRARSAGITDLRFGNVQAADWQGRAQGQSHDDRVPTPLPQGVHVGLIAATTAAQPRGLRHALLGDGLVDVASAFGEHRRPALRLDVPASHKRLLTSANHWDLLSRSEACEQLQAWLAEPARPHPASRHGSGFAGPSADGPPGG